MAKISYIKYKPNSYFQVKDFYLKIFLAFILKICLFNKTGVRSCKEIKEAYPASIVDNAEICFIFELPEFLEFSVGALLLDELIHKCFVCGLGKPTLFIQ